MFESMYVIMYISMYMCLYTSLHSYIELLDIFVTKCNLILYTAYISLWTTLILISVIRTDIWEVVYMKNFGFLKNFAFWKILCYFFIQYFDLLQSIDFHFIEMHHFCAKVLCKYIFTIILCSVVKNLKRMFKHSCKYCWKEFCYDYTLIMMTENLLSKKIL